MNILAILYFFFNYVFVSFYAGSRIQNVSMNVYFKSFIKLKFHVKKKRFQNILEILFIFVQIKPNALFEKVYE